MKPTYLNTASIDAFIVAALTEDIGDGDHSSLASIPAHARNSAQALMKDDGVVAGMDLAGRIFKKVDPSLSFDPIKKDGETVNKGDVLFRVNGYSRAILTAERLVLNCIQRMSGIATYTDHLTRLITGTKAKLLDTRKTTPNFRIMEKWAVLIGGGMNHRFGLFDMIILKDNHVDFAGGIKNAILSTKQYLEAVGKPLKIEIETRNLEEVRQVLSVGQVHRIMLDNMSIDMMKEAVRLINGQYETEASGGINEKTIRPIAETSVDYISVGALTHSAKSLDISLKASQ